MTRKAVLASVVMIAATTLSRPARADEPNMIPNPGFESGMASWVASPGMKAPGVVNDRPGAAHSGDKFARLKAEGQTAGIDCARRFVIGQDLMRTSRYVLSACLRNAGVSKGDFGCRIYFYDVDAGYVKMYSVMSLRPKSPSFGWKKHSAAFGAESSMPIPGAAATCLIRFSVWDKSGSCTCDVSIDDVSLAPDPTFVPKAAGRARCAAVWQDPGLGVKPATDPAAVMHMLKQAGLEAQTIGSDGLCAEAKLSRVRFDTLVLPYADVYPAMGGKALRRFLRDGGSFISLTGNPFSRPIFKSNGRWTAADDAGEERARVDEGVEWLLTHAGHGEGLERAAAKDEHRGAHSRFSVGDLKGYAYAGVAPPALPADAEMLVFDARGDAATRLLCIELQERDGSRWKHVVALRPEWAEYRVHAASFLSYASEDRGKGLDCLRPANAAKVFFGFTASMVGKGRHGFDLARIRFCRALVPAQQVVRSHFLGAGAGLARRFFGSDIKDDAGGPFVGCFAGLSRFTNAAALCPAPAQPLVRGEPVRGDFSGWALTADLVVTRAEGKRRRLFAGTEFNGRFIPLLTARDTAGQPLGVAAGMMCHERGEYAQSVWAAFTPYGLDFATAENRALREGLASVARFVSRGVACRPLGASFVAGPTGAVMKLQMSVFNRGASPVSLSAQSVLTSGKAQRSYTRQAAVKPGLWTNLLVLSLPTAAFDWQGFDVRVMLTAADAPVTDNELRASLNTRAALRDVGEFFCKAGRDDGQFGGISFVDNRGARGLLGAYEILGEDRYRQAAVNWGLTMIEAQREDGGYRMGYGIGPKGEACYVADGGEIAVGMARLVSYTKGAQQKRFMDSLRAYMRYRDSFRCKGGGIGVGWCLQDYGKRPIPKLDKPTRIYAPENNTYTIGCTLAAAYAYAMLTGDPKDERAAEADAEWLMRRARSLSGAFIESYLYAHAFTTRQDYRKRYQDFIDGHFIKPMLATSAPWWLGGAGRAALNLDGLAYCCHRLESHAAARDPHLAAKMMEAAYAIFSSHSRHSVYKLMAKDKCSMSDWIYLCFSYVSLPDVVSPMITMKPFDKVD